MYEAKINFSKIINLVEHNKEVLISESDKTIAKIISFIAHSTGKREFGTLKGKIKVNKGFYKEFPKDIIDDFYLGKLW